MTWNLTGSALMFFPHGWCGVRDLDARYSFVRIIRYRDAEGPTKTWVEDPSNWRPLLVTHPCYFRYIAHNGLDSSAEEGPGPLARQQAG